jgi:CRP-like cAMP-binding protein
MALTEIINSGEVIEEEKSNAVDRGHMHTWSDLYSQLNQEESNALFYSLKEYTFKPGQVILKQGGMNTRSSFIDSGEADIFYRRENNNYLIRKAGPGDMLGADSFFPITNCTAYARSINILKVHYLSRENYNRLSARLPSLGSTLIDYYIETEKKMQAYPEKYQPPGAQAVQMARQGPIKILSPSGAPTRTVFKAEGRRHL